MSIINGINAESTKNAEIIIKKPVVKNYDNKIPAGVNKTIAITLELCVI